MNEEILPPKEISKKETDLNINSKSIKSGASIELS